MVPGVDTVSPESPLSLLCEKSAFKSSYSWKEKVETSVPGKVTPWELTLVPLFLIPHELLALPGLFVKVNRE